MIIEWWLRAPGERYLMWWAWLACDTRRLGGGWRALPVPGTGTGTGTGDTVRLWRPSDFWRQCMKHSNQNQYARCRHQWGDFKCPRQHGSRDSAEPGGRAASNRAAPVHAAMFADADPATLSAIIALGRG